MFAPTDRTHPEHKRHLRKATRPPSGPAVTLAPGAVRSWLVTPQTTAPDVCVDVTGPKLGPALTDLERQAAMLRKAAHRRACHMVGHRVRKQCDACRAKRCAVCAMSPRERAAEEEAKGAPLACVRKPEESRSHLAAVERKTWVPCWARRCGACPVSACEECAPDERTGRHPCVECREADRPTGAEKLSLHRQASAILRGAGLDPRTAAPDADARAHAVGELRALLTDLRDVARTFCALAPLLAQ